MTDRDSFLRAIREIPHDDTARLVYADYLQEDSSEDSDEFRHGVLIRVQYDAESNQEQFICREKFYSCGENDFFGTHVACGACKKAHFSVTCERELLAILDPCCDGGSGVRRVIGLGRSIPKGHFVTLRLVRSARHRLRRDYPNWRCGRDH